VRFGRSRSSKMIDFGANQKRVCDFLLVRHRNHGPILHRFRDIAGFYAHDPTPTPPSFWGCSRWTRSPMSGSMWAIRPWNYFRSIPTYVYVITDTCTSRTDGPTDGQTYDILWHNRALRSIARLNENRIRLELAISNVAYINKKYVKNADNFPVRKHG